jgi:hypothetical protein
MRPPHYCGDLVSGVDRKRANVLSIDGKRQRPFVPKLSELLSVVFDAAISFDPKRLSAPTIQATLHHKT